MVNVSRNSRTASSIAAAGSISPLLITTNLKNSSVSVTPRLINSSYSDTDEFVV